MAFSGQDNRAAPVEYVLVALGACLTVEAGEDIRGMLGADRNVRNGFNGVKVIYKIDADATADEIRALLAQSQRRSAVPSSRFLRITA